MSFKLVFFVFLQVDGANMNRHFQIEKFDFNTVRNNVTSGGNSDLSGSTQIRKHKLKNMCSNKLVNVYEKNDRFKVSAKRRRGVTWDSSKYFFANIYCHKGFCHVLLNVNVCLKCVRC